MSVNNTTVTRTTHAQARTPRRFRGRGWKERKNERREKGPDSFSSPTSMSNLRGSFFPDYYQKHAQVRTGLLVIQQLSERVKKKKKKLNY